MLEHTPDTHTHTARTWETVVGFKKRTGTPKTEVKFWKKKWLDEAIKYTSKIATKMLNRNLTKTNNVDFKRKEKNES